LERCLQADATVEIVEHRGDDQHDEKRRERPARDELEEREPEHVEADVLVELRILHAEVARVGEEDPAPPLRRDAAAHHDCEEEGNAEANAARVGIDDAAITLDDLVLGPGRPREWRQAIGHDQIDVQEDEEHHREDRGRKELGLDEGSPGVREPDFLEPEIVGVEPRETPRAQEQHHEDDRDTDQPAANSDRTSSTWHRGNTHWADVTW
jgi:hypothetical protein